MSKITKPLLISEGKLSVQSHGTYYLKQDKRRVEIQKSIDIVYLHILEVSPSKEKNASFK